MATLFERAGAYFIDILIFNLLLSIICFNLPVNDKYEKQMSKINEQYITSVITVDKYINEYQTIIYNYQRSNMICSCANIALSIAYFIVFAYIYNGQTIGKKLFKIKVVNNKNKQNVSLIQMIIRSLLLYSVVSELLNILFLFILTKNSYLIEYILMSTVQLLFIIVSLLLIINRKDKRGLHDLMAGTIVIKERG